MTTDPPGREQGVLITLREIYNTVKTIEDKMDDELGKLKAQVAAQWVIHAIMVAVIINVVSRTL